MRFGWAARFVLLASCASHICTAPSSHISVTTSGSLTGRHRLTRTPADTTQSVLLRLAHRLQLPPELLVPRPSGLVLQACHSHLNVTVRSHAAQLHNGTLNLQLRSATGTSTHLVSAANVALVIVDMWSYHWCKTVQARTDSLSARIRTAISAAHRLGIRVIAAPTTGVESLSGHPLREAAVALASRDRYNHQTADVPLSDAPVPPPAPYGCMCGSTSTCPFNFGETEQHPSVTTALDQHDYIVGGIHCEEHDRHCSDAHELAAVVREHKLSVLIYSGVATNACITDKAVGMRRAATLQGVKVVLARDLTAAQTATDPDQGTIDAIAHVERYVAPSVSFQLTAGSAWPVLSRPHQLVIAPWGTYKRPHIFSAPELLVQLGIMWDGELRGLSKLPTGTRVVYAAQQLDLFTQHQPLLCSLEMPDLAVVNESSLKLMHSCSVCFVLVDRQGHVLSSTQGVFFRKPSMSPPKPNVPLWGCPLYWRHQSNIMRRVPYVNKSWGGRALVLRGRTFSSGLGLWAPMALTYELDPSWCAFVALVGIGEAFVLGHFKGHLRAPYASARVVVYLDGRKVHESPMLSVQGEVWPMLVPIAAGSKMMRLIATDGGDGHLIDFVDLVKAGFMLYGHSSCSRDAD